MFSSHPMPCSIYAAYLPSITMTALTIRSEAKTIPFCTKTAAGKDTSALYMMRFVKIDSGTLSSAALFHLSRQKTIFSRTKFQTWFAVSFRNLIHDYSSGILQAMSVLFFRTDILSRISASAKLKSENSLREDTLFIPYAPDKLKHKKK